MSLSKVIEIARGELGVTENPPGSNRVKSHKGYVWYKERDYELASGY